jgi:hypothetical protein
MSTPLPHNSGRQHLAPPTHLHVSLIYHFVHRPACSLTACMSVQSGRSSMW